MDLEIGRHLIDSERWMRLLSHSSPHARPALFLDRDGVIMEDRGYLSDPDGVALISGCSAVISAATARGFAVVVVSNQSGVGRGYFTWREHDQIERRLLELLSRDGAQLDALLANSATSDAADKHDWRKPHSGMLTAAARALNLDLARSLIVGDKASDLAAGRTAGLAKGVHVLTGHGPEERQKASDLGNASFTVLCVNSIADVRP